MKTTYEVDGFLKHAEEDLFEEGCVGRSSEYYGDMSFSADSIDALVNELRGFFNICDADCISLDSCDEPGRIDLFRDECDDTSEPSKEHLELWKQGKARLWYCTYTFNVERVTRSTVSLQETTTT